MSGWHIVTGGSRGVGLEICRGLIDRGQNVICLSRRPSGIENKINHQQVCCDLSEASSIDNAASLSRDIIGDAMIRSLIFNAAAARYGNTLEMNDEHIKKMMDVNFLGPVRLLKRLKDKMAPDTEIIYVSTSASRIPAPYLAYYAATKLAFESFVLSAAMEYGYRVHIVRPAEIDTGFAMDSGVPSHCDEGKKKLSAREVADKALDAMSRGKIFINVGMRAKIIDLIVRLFPSVLLKRRRR